MILGRIGWRFRVIVLSAFVLISFAVFLPSLEQLSANPENFQRPIRVSWEEEVQERIEASFNQKKDSNLSVFVLSTEDISKIENSTSLTILLAEEAFEINLIHEREVSLRPFNLAENINLDSTSEEEKSSANLGDFESLNLILTEWLSENFSKEKNQDRISSSILSNFSNSISTLNHNLQSYTDLRSVKKFRRYLAKLTHSDPNRVIYYLSHFFFAQFLFFHSFSLFFSNILNQSHFLLGSTLRCHSLASLLTRFYNLNLPFKQREQIA
ncbi:hypothetical protein EHR05_14775 [Leptospira licerasiae]|nr:hypothetical protein EHR05_14775 [Leptospira licerasiae]